MAQRPPRPRRGDAEINEFIRQHAEAGDGATAIGKAIEKQFPGRLPSPRKIEEIVREWRPRDPAEPWSLADADASEAPAVVPLLGAVLEHTAGRVRTLSNEEAEWVALIRTIAPDLEDEWDVYRLARHAIGGLVDDVLWYLAFAPWRDDGARYARAYAEGWISNVIYRFETPGEALGFVKRPGRIDE